MPLETARNRHQQPPLSPGWVPVSAGRLHFGSLSSSRVRHGHAPHKVVRKSRVDPPESERDGKGGFHQILELEVNNLPEKCGKTWNINQRHGFIIVDTLYCYWKIKLTRVWSFDNFSGADFSVAELCLVREFLWGEWAWTVISLRGMRMLTWHKQLGLQQIFLDMIYPQSFWWIRRWKSHGI